MVLLFSNRVIHVYWGTLLNSIYFRFYFRMSILKSQQSKKHYLACELETCMLFGALLMHRVVKLLIKIRYVKLNMGFKVLFCSSNWKIFCTRKISSWRYIKNWELQLVIIALRYGGSTWDASDSGWAAFIGILKSYEEMN